ncbi:DUF883 domain-containing protein [Cognaticolwellia beringensis]|uniref:DUF883 domain-containing protein n=1 Tax=Cognaticolwellia beringensis TaxID=1967665 RepID=A0A222G4L5_9GAMM|nr:DUF883 domain-containing protein [Cognaticolwellia beringensis]ASP46769.1 DUF883 domain-containing protein [Cognaticolwellia beringensis]
MASTTSNNEKKAQSTHPLSDKVQDALHESVDTLAEKAAHTEDRLRNAAQSSSENFEAKQQEVQAKWDQSSLKKYATENPIATAGIAFAAGVLLTSIFRRK